MINIKLDMGGARAKIEGFEERAKNLKPVLQDFAAHMEGSILENFIQGGRPNKWKASSSEKTLRRTGQLQNSLTSRFSDRSIDFGTNVKYGRIQHKGGVIKPKKARALAIPLQDWIKGGPRRYSNLDYIPPKKGDPDSRGLLGQKKGDGIVPMFALRASATIQARPWLMFQDEDREYAKQTLNRYLRTGVI